MTRRGLLALVLIAILVTPAYANDKSLHFGGGLLLGATSDAGIYYGIGAGLGKEAVDETWDWDDVRATAVGAWLGHELRKPDDILWKSFLVGQAVNMGNMIYQQEGENRHEVNGLYGDHPSTDRIYLTKIAECYIIKSLIRTRPTWSRPVLVLANLAVWGMVVNDLTHYDVPFTLWF